MKHNTTVLGTVLNDKAAAIKEAFLKEWTPQQFKRMETAIATHFANKPINTHHGKHEARIRTFKVLGEIMGFAYTSTGDYAGYWVCNTAVYNDKYQGYDYTGFALTADNKPFAILWDAEENEIIIPL